MKKNDTNDLVNNVLPALFKKQFLSLLDAKGDIESAIKKKAVVLDEEIAALKIPKKKEGVNTHSSKLDFNTYEDVFDFSSNMFFQALLNGAYELDINENFHNDGRGSKILKMIRRRALRDFAFKLFTHYFADRLHSRKVPLIMYLVGISEYAVARSSPIESLNVIAETDDPVLITGETGTGKELLAQAIHYLSRRKEKVFIPINCGGVNEETLLSELFGHVRGAFSGAISDKKGAFELADKGTLFLDEVGDMHSKLQIALLRTLNDGKIQRLGEYGKDIQVDTRIIAATNKNLRQEVRNGNFREDLYYRLCVHPIRLPAFRDLPEDARIDKIRMIFNAVLQEQSAKDINLAKFGVMDYAHSFNANSGQWRGPLDIDESDLKSLSISKEAMVLLINRAMPGNYRQIYSIIKNAWVKTKQRIEVEHLSSELLNSDTEIVGTPSEAWVYLPEDEFRKKIDDIEKKRVSHFLQDNKWDVSKAARQMGMERYILSRKLTKLGLKGLSKKSAQKIY